MDRAARRPDHRTGGRRRAPQPHRDGVPALQPVRLPHRPAGSNRGSLKPDPTAPTRRRASSPSWPRPPGWMSPTCCRSPCGSGLRELAHADRRRTRAGRRPRRRADRGPARPRRRRMKSRELLADLGVLVIRAAAQAEPVDDRAFVRFLRSFGELMFTVGETPVAGLRRPERGDQRRPHHAAAVDVPRRHQLCAPPARLYRAAGGTIPRVAAPPCSATSTGAYETLPARCARRTRRTATVRHVVTGVHAGRRRGVLRRCTRCSGCIRYRGARRCSCPTPQRCVAVSAACRRSTAATPSAICSSTRHAPGQRLPPPVARRRRGHLGQPRGHAPRRSLRRRR